MRGASFAISQLTEKEKNLGVITHSSGNHAQAVALAAKLQGLKAEIVMPKTAPKIKVKGVQAYNGKITFCEPSIADRQNTVDSICSRKKLVFISPFNDFRIIAGQATCAKEIIEQIENLDAIICPVGGGGLLSGTILAATYFGANIKVYGAEPIEVNDAKRSLETGNIEKNETTNTIADGLMTHLGELNFEIIKKGVERIFEVSETEIKDAMRLVWERMKIIIEPSSAVPLAGNYQKQRIIF